MFGVSKLCLIVAAFGAASGHTPHYEWLAGKAGDSLQQKCGPDLLLLALESWLRLWMDARPKLNSRHDAASEPGTTHCIPPRPAAAPV